MDRQSIVVPPSGSAVILGNDKKWGQIRALTMSDEMGSGANFTNHCRKSIRRVGSFMWAARIRRRDFGIAHPLFLGALSAVRVFPRNR
jgi:hypothetical protein